MKSTAEMIREKTYKNTNIEVCKECEKELETEEE